MEQLIKSVKDNNCDIGLAFDGDGDRLGVVDNLGNLVWADQYMLILCSEIANLYQSPKVIMDVKCSKVFFDEAKKLGCEPLMERTGHSPIKEKMKEIKSPLSGEMSGHVCYGDDFYGYDDAMYVGLRLLRILGNKNKNLKINHINNRSNSENTSKLIKYDSIHGKLNADLDYDPNHLIINKNKITFSQETKIEDINWKKHDVDYVFECTGKFNSKENFLIIWKMVQKK